jgi:hypothetical protein
MQMAEYLPVQVFGLWHQIPRFFVTKAAPAFATSGAMFSQASKGITSILGGSSEGDNSSQDKNRLRIEKDYGLSKDTQVELETLTAKSIFSESTVGANSEVLQCLKKGPSALWGNCDDYAVFVTELANLERSREVVGAEGQSKVRLKVKAYFAESDVMIGKKGQTYFEECWKGKDGEFEDVLDFTTRTIEGTDHDTVTKSLEVLEPAFQYLAGMLDDGAA